MGPSSIGVSNDSRDSSREPLPEEFHDPYNSSNTDGGSGTCSEEPIFGMAERLVDEIDKVTQLVISPSSSDHILVLGACIWEPATGGGMHRRTSEVM